MATGQKLPEWHIVIARPKAQHVGWVHAPTAEEAIKVAIKQFKIADPEKQKRLAARPMGAKPTLYGRELSDAELEAIRAEIESFDTIDGIDDEMRELIASQWPHLLVKLPRSN